MESFLTRAVDRVFGYDFFISYSHADGKSYPRILKSRLEQAGFKVFLDQTEYAAGADLRRETRRQVKKSQKLVVIGREAALKSPWVKREIDVILAEGRTPILININGCVERAPAGSDVANMAREQHWLRLEETIDDLDSAPTDYAVTELVRSFGAMRQETKRQRLLAGTAAVLGLLAVSAGYLAWLSEQRRKEADERLLATLDTATQFVNQTVRMSDKYGVPREYVLELLKEPEQVFLKLSKSGVDTPEVRQRRAQTLLDFADNYELLGDSTQRVARAREAARILEEIVQTHTGKPEWELLLATAHSKIGTALLFQGDKSGAKTEYEEALRIRKSLADRYPSNLKMQRDYSVAINRMGEVLIAAGRYEEARVYLKSARDMRQQLLSTNPNDKDLKRDLFICQIWLGDSYKAEQKFADARAEYSAARDISENLAQDGTSKTAQRDFSVSLNKIGETYLGENNAAEAKPFYERALPIRKALADSDQGNRGAQRDLFVSYVQLGHVFFLEKQIDKAQAYFRDALSISETLLEKDPSYGHWAVDAAEAKGWVGMTSGKEGQVMVRDALARLETLRNEGKLPADRQVLITQFKGLLDDRAGPMTESGLPDAGAGQPLP